MIEGVSRQELNTETILSKVSEYDIFRYYMPNKLWKLNDVTYSPFRKERNPSFLIGNKYGHMTFVDFADTGKRGNCFDFVKCLYGIDRFYDVLLKIDEDFGLGISSQENVGEYKRIIAEYKQPTDVIKRYCFIQVETRRFTTEELAYWNQYHQDIEDLKRNNIYSVKALYLNRRRFPLKDTELRFGYLYGEHWKIYRPFANRKNKWMPNNVEITQLDGKDNIKDCEVAFINKSKKDYMVMSKVFSCSVAVQNEGIGCFSPENVEWLKSNSRKQILSFDSDVTGVANSQQITKLFDFGYCNVPRKYLTEGIKDWADLGKTYGLKVIEDYLKEKGLI